MDKKDISYYQFAVAVAASCAEVKEKKQDLQGSIRMIEDAIKLILHGTGIKASVIPIAYPAACKHPLLISLSNGCKRLLWYYPQMDVPDLALALEDLLYDVVDELACVSA